MPAFVTAILKELGRQAGSRAFLMALVFILPCATFLIGLDLAFAYGRLDGAILPWQLNLSEDESIGEYFEYGLTLLAAFWMMQLWRRERAPVLLVAYLLFIWLTLDNALALHEAGGSTLAPLLQPLAGERAADLGELIVFGLVSLCLLAMVTAGLRASPAEAGKRTLCSLLFVAGAAGFGVGMDFVSHFAATTMQGGLILDLIEDSGELVMLCLAVAFAAAIRFNTPAALAPASAHRSGSARRPVGTPNPDQPLKESAA